MIRRFILIACCLLSSSALAQSNEGAFSWGYPFDLPAAQGRYQPRLGLSYNSEGGNTSYGVGWGLNISYIEPNTTASLDTSGNSRNQWLLTLDGSSSLLVSDPTSSDPNDFRPDVASGYLRVHQNSGSWIMTDAVGTQYRFDLVNGYGTRYYLQLVTDVDGNQTEYLYQNDLAYSVNSMAQSSATLQYIFYNYVGTSAGTIVSLNSSSGSGGNQVVDNVYAQHPLLGEVVVSRRADSGSTYRLYSYSMGYQTSLETGRQLLTQIQRFGTAGSGTEQGPAVDLGYTFSYSGQNDAGPWYTLEAPMADAGIPAVAIDVSLCDALRGTDAGVACAMTDVAAFADVDNDGLPDLVWGTPDSGISWARNVSRPGQIAFSINPVFGNLPEQMFQAGSGAWPGSISFGNPAGAISGTQEVLSHQQAQLIDLNDDGFLDLVATNDPACTDAQDISVRYGTSTQSFEAPICTALCLNIDGVCRAYEAWLAMKGVSGGPIEIYSSTAGYGNTQVQLIDMNADGVPDYLISTASGWEYFPGMLDSTRHWQLAPQPASQPAIPVTPLAGTPNLSGFPYLGYASDDSTLSQIILDMNADGYPDIILASTSSSPAFGWTVAFGSPQGNSTYSFFDPLTPLDTAWVLPAWCMSYPYYCPVAASPSASFVQTDSYFPDSYNFPPNGTGSQPMMYPKNGFSLLDVNGDGRPDYVYNETTYPYHLVYLPNYGTGFGPPHDLGFAGSVFSASPVGLCGPGCVSNQGNQEFVDIDGDGILDHVYFVAGQPPEVRLGVTSDGAPHPDMMLTATTPSLAKTTVTYGSSVSFGVATHFRPHAVVTAVATTAPAGNGATPSAITRTMNYWYQTPQVAQSWSDPVRFEQLGFSTTYAKEAAADSVTSSLVTNTVWGATHGTAGAITYQASGPFTSMSAVDYLVTLYSVPQFTNFDATTRAVQSCPLNSSSPYPTLVKTLVVQHDSIETNLSGVGTTTLTSTTSSTCADVDTAGNIAQVTFTRDTSDPRGALTAHSVYPDPSSASVLCKSCVLETYASGGGQDLFRRRYHYDAPTGSFGPAPNAVTSGHLNYVENLVSGTGESAVFEHSAYTKYNPNGTVAAVGRDLAGQSVSSVFTSYLYDASGHVTSSETYDTGSTPTAYSIFTSFVFDPNTGQLASVYGPTQGTHGSPPASGYPRANYHYDSSTLRPTFQSVIDASGGSEYVAAAQGVVPATASTLAYEWATRYSSKNNVAAYYFYWSNIGANDGVDAVKTTSYYDGFGRVLQSRTKLNNEASTSQASAINLIQGLDSSLYLVQGRAMDAVGHTTLVLDPYYSSTASFEDYTVGLPAVSGTTLHGTRFSFDAKSGQTCAQYAQITSSTLPTGSFTCQTNDAAGIRATPSTFGAGTPPGLSGTRAFLAVAGQSDSQSGGAGGGVVTSYADASGMMLYSADAEGNLTAQTRDLLGRVRQTSRIATGGSTISSSFTYDGLGRVVSSTDTSAGTRKYIYSATGQLISIGEVPTWDLPDGVTGVQFTYGTLGRMVGKTQFNNIQAASPGACAASYSYASGDSTVYKYDQPDSGALPSAAFLTGRLSEAMNGTSTIAFSYDSAGHVIERAEAFTAAPSKGWYTVSKSYRNDGAVLSTSVAGSGLTSPVAYNTWYDSLGRAVEVEDGSTVYWSVSQTGAANPNYSSNQTPLFDSLGRLGSIGALSNNTGYWFDKGPGASTPFSGEAHFAYSAASNLLTDYTSSITPTGGSAQPMIAVSGMTYQGSKLRSYNESVSNNAYAFNYDASDRLATADSNQFGTPGGTLPPLHQTFHEYNSFELPSGGGSLATLQSVTDLNTSVQSTYQYSGSDAPSMDQLKTITNTASTAAASYEVLGGAPTALPGRGLISSFLDSQGSVWTYGYDAEMRLTSISGPEHESIGYDPTGTLASRTFVPAPNQVIQLRVGNDLSIDVTGTTTRVSVHLPVNGARIATIRADGTVLYYQWDRLGSIVGTSTNGGGVGAGYRYGVYGTLESSTNVVSASGENYGDDSELRYTGALVLSGGLIYLHARVYSPVMRGFLQPDNEDLKRYTYADADPINNTDPTGHFVSKPPTIMIDGLDMYGFWGQEFAAGGAFAAGSWYQGMPNAASYYYRFPSSGANANPGAAPNPNPSPGSSSQGSSEPAPVSGDNKGAPAAGNPPNSPTGPPQQPSVPGPAACNDLSCDVYDPSIPTMEATVNGDRWHPQNDVTPPNPCEFIGASHPPSFYFAAGIGAKGSTLQLARSALLFRRGNDLDAQWRATGSVAQRAALGNYDFGVFMDGAGFDLFETLMWADAYGMTANYLGQQMDSNFPSIPVQNVINIQRGWTDAANGTICTP